MSQIEKINEQSSNQPQALRKAEIARLLKSVKEAGFNSSKEEDVKDNNFKKRSLLDIALSTSDETEENNFKTENDQTPIQENPSLSEGNISLDETLKADTEQQENNLNEIISQNQDIQDDKSLLNEESPSIPEESIEEKLKNAEELGYTKGHKEGLIAGHEQGVNQARTEAKEGVDAAIAVFRSAAEAIEKTNPQTLNKLHAAIEFSILEMSKELSGFAIDSLPEKYIQRIKSLSETINKKMNEVNVSINEADLKAIEKFLKENEDLNAVNFQLDENLNRGDIILNADGINIDDVFDSAEIEETLRNKFNSFSIGDNPNPPEELTSPETDNINIGDNPNPSEELKSPESNGEIK